MINSVVRHAVLELLRESEVLTGSRLTPSNYYDWERWANIEAIERVHLLPAFEEAFLPGKGKVPNELLRAYISWYKTQNDKVPDNVAEQHNGHQA